MEIVDYIIETRENGWLAKKLDMQFSIWLLFSGFTSITF